MPFLPSAGDGFRLLKAPYGHFYADPFILEHAGRVFLFLEDYEYLTRKGKLACMELSQTGEVLETRTIVQRPYHLSYPHVFFLDGSYYMIPETASADQVELYRAVNFPWEWRLERILLSGIKLQDPTYVVIDGKHWIFGGGSSAPGRYDQLNLFHASSIHGRFRAHSGNPVKTNVTSARPGGGILMAGEHLIRPAQDCSRWYGCGLTFMGIDEITESTYSERPVLRLPGAWVPGDYLGTHTFNTSENFEVIDVCSYGLELPAIAGRARTLAFKIAPYSSPTLTHQPTAAPEKSHLPHPISNGHKPFRQIP
jgi:hypothetical protein